MGSVDIDWKDIMVLISACIGVIIQIPCFITLMIRLRKEQQTKIFRRNKLCVILAYISAIVTTFGQFWYSLTDNQRNKDIAWEITDTAPVGVSLSTYMFLLFRLYYVFKDTYYRTSKTIFYLHGIFWVILLLFAIVPVFFEWIAHIHLFSELIEDSIWVIVLSMIFGHLLYNFNHKLFLLVISQKQTMYFVDSSQDEIDNKSMELNQRQIRLLNTMRKQTILGCIMVISNLMYAASIWVIRVLEFLQESDTDEYSLAIKIVYCINLVLWSIFTNGAPFAINLSFRVNTKFYMRICGSCDNKCRRYYVHKAEKRISCDCHNVYRAMSDDMGTDRTEERSMNASLFTASWNSSINSLYDISSNRPLIFVSPATNIPDYPINGLPALDSNSNGTPRSDDTSIPRSATTCED